MAFCQTKYIQIMKMLLMYSYDITLNAKVPFLTKNVILGFSDTWNWGLGLKIVIFYAFRNPPLLGAKIFLPQFFLKVA